MTEAARPGDTGQANSGLPMPLVFHVMPHRNLVVARYRGFAGLHETVEKAAECAAHPGFRPTMRHLVDLMEITGYERDFPRYFAMQATVMEKFFVPGAEHVFVYLAPTRPGQEMAQMVRRSWEGLDHLWRCGSSSARPRRWPFWG